MSYRLFPNISPVLPSNAHVPTNPAFRCRSIEQWEIAVGVFSFKYREKREANGPWHKWTIGTLNNWIASLIRLRYFVEAEKLCRDTLKEMTEESIEMSTPYCGVECSLAICLLLSGQFEAAESLRTQIESHPVFYAYGPAEDAFEVMSATFETGSNCVVLRESGDGLRDLEEINDYTICHLVDTAPVSPSATLRSRQGDETGLSPSPSMGRMFNSLRRKASFPRKTSIKHNPIMSVDATIGRNPAASHHRDVRKMRSIAEGRPLPIYDSLVFSESDTSQHAPSGPQSRASAAGAPPNILQGHHGSTQEDSIAGLGSRVQDHPPSTPPRVSKKLDDGHPQDWPLPNVAKHYSPPAHVGHGRKNLSVDTTRSSHLKDLKLQNKLNVIIYTGRSSISWIALLDSGAEKNCISEGMYNVLEVAMEQKKVEDVVVADGQRLDVLGEVKISFSWECSGRAPNLVKFPFYVVKDLQVGMLICENYIAHLRSQGLLLAPILLASRCRKGKSQDADRTERATANAEIREAIAAAQRKAKRDALPPTSPRRDSSLIGGSETTAESRSSSLDGLSHSSSASST